MNHGETPARRALRENSVAASGAVKKSLDEVLWYLNQEKFITAGQRDSILTTSGVSAAHKAGQALGAVEAKVDSGNDPVKGREWLEVFLRILRRQDIGEETVARDIAKVYVRYADKRSEGYKFFDDIAREESLNVAVVSGEQVQGDGKEEDKQEQPDEPTTMSQTEDEDSEPFVDIN